MSNMLQDMDGSTAGTVGFAQRKRAGPRAPLQPLPRAGSEAVCGVQGRAQGGLHAQSFLAMRPHVPEETESDSVFLAGSAEGWAPAALVQRQGACGARLGAAGSPALPGELYKVRMWQSLPPSS